MKKFSSIFLLVLGCFFAFFACTNPEVNFPDEKKEEEKKKETPFTVYTVPTLLVYPQGADPAVFYYLIALARANGASETLFLPVPAVPASIREGIIELRKFHGKNPAIVAFQTDLSFLTEEDRENTGPLIILFAPAQTPQNRGFILLPETPVLSQESSAQGTGGENIPQNQETAAKTQDPEQKTEKENARKGQNIRKKTQETPAGTEDKNPQSEKENKEDKKLDAASSPKKEKKKMSQSVWTVSEKTNISSSQTVIRQKMKDPAFLSIVIQKAMETFSINSSFLSEEILYLKGKTLPYSQFSLWQKQDTEYREKFSSASGRDGLFSALIVKRESDYYLKLSALREKEWSFFLQGLRYSYPFFLFLPPQEGIAEIRSFFTPFSSQILVLPEGISLPETKTNPVTQPVYRAVFLEGEKPDWKQEENTLWITLPGNLFPLKMKLGDQEREIKKGSTWIFLD